MAYMYMQTERNKKEGCEKKVKEAGCHIGVNSEGKISKQRRRRENWQGSGRLDGNDMDENMLMVRAGIDNRCGELGHCRLSTLMNYALSICLSPLYHIVRFSGQPSLVLLPFFHVCKCHCWIGSRSSVCKCSIQLSHTLFISLCLLSFSSFSFSFLSLPLLLRPNPSHNSICWYIS